MFRAPFTSCRYRHLHIAPIDICIENRPTLPFILSSKRTRTAPSAVSKKAYLINPPAIQENSINIEQHAAQQKHLLVSYFQLNAVSLMINKHLQEQVTNYLSIDMRQDAVREYYLNLFIISVFCMLIPQFTAGWSRRIGFGTPQRY